MATKLSVKFSIALVCLLYLGCTRNTDSTSTTSSSTGSSASSCSTGSGEKRCQVTCDAGKSALCVDATPVGEPSCTCR